MPNFPTRQGQHFNLNLGQNDGPYKSQGQNGQPIMLDKFNTSTFAQEIVSNTGNSVVMRNYSPRVAILGNQTFSQEGHSAEDRVVKISDEPSNTVAKQVERMEEQVRLGFELLGKFKQESSQLRNEMDSLMNQLIKKVEDVEAEVKPEIYNDYKQMKADIRQ